MTSHRPSSMRLLGRTEVAVGPLGFGAVPLGNLYRALTERQAAETVSTAIARGLRYFDTAPLYGLGLSERRLGLYLSELPRDQYVLSTKVGRTLSPARAAAQGGIFVEPPPFAEAFDFSYDGVMRQFEDSLQRLGVSRLDCAVIHDLGLWHMKDRAVVDGHFRTLETGGLRALLELKRDGRIGAIGAGANELTLCDRFLGLGAMDFILMALRYTLLDQSANEGVLDKALSQGVSIVVGAPFQSGILASGVIDGAHYNYGDTPREVAEKVRNLCLACQEHDVPLKAAALQFPMQHRAVTSVLAGMGSAQEVIENVTLAAHPIPPSFWSALKQKGLTA